MPSDSIAGFLDNAKATRVLIPEQVEQLIRQPDIPHSGLGELCSYLLERGVLTRYQADALREGRGYDLSFGAYPVLDVLGPCPGGTAYRALHPSLRTPLVLRRLAADAFAPTDTATAVVNRARTFGTIQHPNLTPLLDAGAHDGLPYAVLEQPTDAAPLDVLLAEVGGAMPGFLAAEYGSALASALRAIHELGGWHGEVRPGLLLVGPLTFKTAADGTTKRRPAPNATIKLTETGLIPLRGPAAQDPPPANVLAYLPPERFDAPVYTAQGDIYGLGASLYLMLAGRPPFAADDTAELIAKIRSHAPAPLSTVRPDLSAGLAALVMQMLSKRPEERPQSAAEVGAALAPFCRPAVAPAAVPTAAPVSSVVSGLPAVPYAVPVAPEARVEAEPEPDVWAVNPSAFVDAEDESDAAPKPRRRRGLTEKEKSRAKLWVVLGLCLHLTAVAMLIAAFMGGCLDFGSSPDPEPPVNKQQNPTKPPSRQQRTKTT